MQPKLFWRLILTSIKNNLKQHDDENLQHRR